MTTAEPMTGTQAPARTRVTATLLPTPPGPEVLQVRPLTQATLYSHGARIAVPTYDRAALTPAVVHLSVGGFSRAHQLIYFDELAERRISTGWGVVGVGLRQRHLQDLRPGGRREERGRNLGAGRRLGLRDGLCRGHAASVLPRAGGAVTSPLAAVLERPRCRRGPRAVRR